MEQDSFPICDGGLGGGNRRQTGRVHVGGVRCNRGKIVDLSARGARMLTRLTWKEGEARLTTLRSGNTSVLVQARCVWRRREGLLRHLVGVSFEACTPEQAAKLVEIARNCSTASEFKFAA